MGKMELFMKFHVILNLKKVNFIFARSREFLI